MQVWEVDGLGGFLYSDNLSDKLRSEVVPVVKFRQLCDARDAMELGLHNGDTYNWNVYSRVAEGGGTLDEQEEMPSTNFTIVQQSLTITEYGNSVPYSGKLNNLSRQPVTEIIRKSLKYDCVETMDIAAHAQYNATRLTVAPAGGTSTTAVTVEEGGCTVTNNVAFGNDHVKAVVDVMKERNIPPFINDDYYAVGWPTTFRAMKNDLEALAQYVETGFRHIMNGEVGRYEGLRILEQTHIAKGGAVDSTTWTGRVADAWDNALSDWIFFLGEDTVAEAVAVPEEIRGKIPTDYGRSRGVAWYALLGFGIVHNSASADMNSRIVKWESAA